MLRFIDWSLNNPAFPDWAAEKARGLDGAVLKATEGTYGAYQQTRTNWDALAANGMLRGVYDFGMPDLDAPIAEANFFLNTCQREGITFAPHDLIFLDFERIGRLGAANPSEWALTWLQTVGAAVGQAPGFPGVYCTYDYVQNVLTDPRFSQYTLWLAAWTRGAGGPNNSVPTQNQAPRLPAGSAFSEYALWQWSASSFNFPSVVVPGAGVDESLSFLDRATFTAKYGKRDPHPQPQYRVVVDQWLRAKPDATSARLIDVPVGATVVQYGAPTPNWLLVTYQGVHGWMMREHVEPA